MICVCISGRAEPYDEHDKKLLLTGICTAVILLLSHFLSTYAFAADSDGAVEVRRLEMGIKNVTLRVNQDRNVLPHYSGNPEKRRRKKEAGQAKRDVKVRAVQEKNRTLPDKKESEQEV